MDDARDVKPPERLVLATDLSARCDRALDRACQLARHWGARLLAVHAVEPAEQVTRWYTEHHLAVLPRAINPLSIAIRRLRRSLGGTIDDIDVVVTEGEPARIVADAAGTGESSLIVTGIARDETLGRLHIGSTVEALVREAVAPVLIVRDRPLAPYRRIVVASDFSEGSDMVLRTAVSWFPDTRLTLLHAFEAPFAGLLADRETYRADYRSVVAPEAESFLAAAGLRPEMLDVVLEPGDPARVLADHVEARDIELVVIGTGEKSLLRRLLVGDTDTTILAEVPCDILVVPKGGAPETEGDDGPA